MEPYDLIFDINNGFKNWGFSAFGMIFTGFGLIFVLVQKKLNLELKRKYLPQFLIFFGVLTSVFLFGISYSDYYSSLNDFKAGNYRVIEGEVISYKEMSPGGKVHEQFTVGDQTFSFSPFEITPG